MARSRALWAVAALLTVGAAVALASLDWCPPKETGARLVASGHQLAPVLAGAAEVELFPPLPAPRAGYASPRVTAERIAAPLKARAVVVRADALAIGLVSVDLLLVPDSLVAKVRERISALRLDWVFVVASHTHSSFGGFDPRWPAQLAGVGRYARQNAEAVVRGVSEGLIQAAATAHPVRIVAAEAAHPSLVANRSGARPVDPRITRLVLLAEGGPLAQVIIYSAHPTLVPRDWAVLDPDYPGRFAEAQRKAGNGVTLVLQGAGGNAAVPPERAHELLGALGSALPEVPFAAPPPPPQRLAFAVAEAPLPATDASRLGVGPLEGLARNALCRTGPPTAEIGALELAGTRLLFLPAEPTVESGERLEQALGVGRVLGLTNGYLGYLEAPERVAARVGEARRQYFGPELMDVLAEAARLPVEALPSP